MEPSPRRRDADRTRRLLLDAALVRFTRDGYAATRLRDVAEDARVNVALVSRYFESKEGLFAACLTKAGDELRRSPGDASLETAPAAIAAQIVGRALPERPYQLLLLLRSSGDERAEQIRLGVLRGYSERLAAAAGEPHRLLEAQVVLAATAGLVLLRKSGLEPLGTATEDDLAGPLRDMIEALLRR
ncbi:TetR/AcrR family transcriptional regulator [Dactylosporangium sucinum]|uniref:TetR/AcrR family transcriptional regulator n=1 Tax=Dactylosporangium sucinum TaxID=1424081 RepID=UPI001E29460A|nr:TetR/AcrR family transcriptional regulator [Dactylosporangium sucinum]